MTPPGDQQPGMQEVQLQVFEVITYPNVIAASVTRMDDGSKVLVFATPHGKQINIPLPSDVAKDIGSQLMAPGIEVASSIAPNGATPPFQI